MSLKGDDDPDKWFNYLLEPQKLTKDIDSGISFKTLEPLLYDFLSNLLNCQNIELFTVNPQELCFARSEERKCVVLRSLCLRLAAYNDWSLSRLEKSLPPPLLLFLLTSLVQIQPGEEENSLANTNKHLELDMTSLASPGPTLHALTLFHRWVVRTYMAIRTPVRAERTSTVMVPGVRKDPAIIHRDQTAVLVSAVAPTSIKLLQSVLDSLSAPAMVPSHSSFPLGPDWDSNSLKTTDKNTFLALVAYDLGRCYLFCEDYLKAKQCFSSYFSFVHNGGQLSDQGKQVLEAEIDKSSLAGCLLCLDMEAPEYKISPQTCLLGDIINSVNHDCEGINDILEKSNEKKSDVMSAREILEEELKTVSVRNLLPTVQIQNIIKRTLMGLPLSLKHRTALANLPDKSLIEEQLSRKISTIPESQKGLLKSLVIDLVINGIITEKSPILKSLDIENLESSPTPPSKEKIRSSQTFQLETLGQDKIVKFNQQLKLLSTFSPTEMNSLIAALGGKMARKTSSRWQLESEVPRQSNIPDQVFVTLAKVAQLKKLRRFGEAKTLLAQSRPGGKSEKQPGWLTSLLESEMSLLELSLSDGVTGPVETERLSRACHNELTVMTITALLNSEDWDGVVKLSQPNLPHVTSLPPATNTIIVLARNIAQLITHIRLNNAPMMKKFGRDLWELVVMTAQGGAGSKRKDAGVDNSVTRAGVTAWLCDLSHQHCCSLVSSLLASLLNVVRDDPNTDILSPEVPVWPTHVSQTLQVRTVEDMFTQVLTSALAKHPHDAGLLRMMADLQFSNGCYASAFALYVETAAVRTDFYQQELGGTSRLDEREVARMMTCARELGHLTQAVVLAQFTQEPNYAQAFKFLEDRSVDGGDCLYGCIWDMAILEFAMSLHTRRGEAARRKQALHCIWQLELNTNNDEEIIKEAANIMNSSFGENLPVFSSESEQGANAALTELEKGLRSAKLGEQAEAIVRFPHLFSQYPFPILINSGMMKLAELFKQGSNFLKMCVLRVFQQSSLHLDKVTSVDEFLRRIITVINSNDPVARALTLRVLGAIAQIIAERKSVHHKVRCSLDSQDEVELYAGIFAADKFAATSKSFSTDMCSKLLEMVHNPATSVPVKLKLVPILQHMHHSAETAAQVRSALVAMLPLYPGQALLTLTMRTLTSLATNTLVDIPAQVSLLLDQISLDTRLEVRLALLSDLSLLARPGTAHHWTRDNIRDMVEFSRREQSDETLCRSIDIVRDIVEVKCHEVSEESLDLLCQQVAYSGQVRVAVRGTELLTVMATAGNMDMVEQAVLAMENLCFVVVCGGVDLSDMKRCLKCVLVLCHHQPQLTGQFVEILGGMMLRCESFPASLQCVLTCLASLASHTQAALAPLVPDITQLVTRLGSQSASKSLILVLTLLLQTLRGHSWSQDAHQTWQVSVGRLDCWQRYRLARAASRYGHHNLAAELFTEIAQYAESDTIYSWLEGLALLSQAENSLVKTTTMSLQDRLTSSLNLFHRAVSSLRCATSSNNSLAFQLEFVSCRLEVVTVLSILVSAATSLSTSPPPAIAAALAAQSRDELQRCGRVTPQLRKVIKQLQDCANKWVKLAEASFDADSRSQALLSLQQQSVSSLATWIDMVCLKSPLQGNIYAHTDLEFKPDVDTEHVTIELAGIISNIKSVAESFQVLAANNSPLAKPISHFHTSCLTEVVGKITSHPFPYPRFFYQSLQQTKIKLQVTPQSKASGEPVAVNTSQFLAVKVEGVIQRSGVLETQRKVAGVVVQLGSSIQKPQVETKADMTSTNIEQEVEPHNDFFVSQFLVPFPTPGLYTVNIDTLWRDQQGKRWRTGAKSTITVKSFEDRSNNNRSVVRS